MNLTRSDDSITECQLVMIAYRKTLKQLIADYAPSSAEEKLSDRFLAAVSSYRKSRDMLDELLSPNYEDKLEAAAELSENGRLDKIKQFIIQKGGPLMWLMK